VQAVILAAGLSRRMGNAAQDRPKCLIEINGKTILGRMLENLQSTGIGELVMTVGYKHQMIRDFITSSFPSLKVIYLLNEGYAENNNAYSLWMTRNDVKGPIFLLDSDILFDIRILKMLLDTTEEDCLAVRTSNTLGEEEMKVAIQKDTAKITDISKKIDPKTAYGESIGIERFSPKFLKGLYAILDRRISKEGKINEFYEASFQEMIETGHSIFAVDIGPKKAAELDFPEDIAAAGKDIIPFI
jgi:choline kinase